MLIEKDVLSNKDLDIAIWNENHHNIGKKKLKKNKKFDVKKACREDKNTNISVKRKHDGSKIFFLTLFWYCPKIKKKHIHTNNGAP